MSRRHTLGQTFLGRRLDERTMCYGEFPAEVAQRIGNLAESRLGQVGQGLVVLAAIDEAKADIAKAAGSAP